MPGYLTQFGIKGLHRVRTINIPIIDNKLVLVGENGTGKSTVANFIYFFLTMQWSRMIEYKFESVSAIIDDEKYEFSYNEISALARQKKSKRGIPRSITIKINDILESHSLQEVLEQVDTFSEDLSIPAHILAREMQHIALEGRVSNVVAERLRSLASSMNSQVLYLPTYRRIEQDLETIFPQLEKILSEDFDHRFFARRKLLGRGGKTRNTGYIELVEFGMEDVEKTIQNKMSEIKENVRQDLNNLTGAYLRDVIQGTHQSVDLSGVDDLNDDRVDSIFKRIPEEILPEKDKVTLRGIITEINETGKISDKNKVVAHFLAKLVQLHQKQQQDEWDIREFVKICNEGYLTGKQFVYDNVSFDVSISQEADNSLNDSPELPMRALSSGEKQIISLFSHLYLSGNPNFFIIIDEPELSLSVPWQRRFLSDMLEKCNGLIAVTHSPFIYDNELKPYTHSLEEFIEPYEYNPELEENELISDEIPF